MYLPPLEHGCAIHCDPSYRGLVFGGGVEARNVPTQSMVRKACPGYPGDKGGACIRGGG